MSRTTILDMASADNLTRAAEVLVSGLAGPSTALVRLWLTDGDGNLELVASAGSPAGGGRYTAINGEFARIAKGIGKIGQIAESREPLVVRGIRGDETWLANPGWISRQGVRSFAGYPLIAGGRSVGVLALFDRVLLSDEALTDLAFLAAFAAIRVSELQAREDERVAGNQRTQAASSREGHSVEERAAARETPPDLLTRSALRALEKRAIEAALARTNGKVFGPNGAARLLEMKPTTLASRIKALGIR